MIKVTNMHEKNVKILKKIYPYINILKIYATIAFVSGMVKTSFAYSSSVLSYQH